MDLLDQGARAETGNDDHRYHRQEQKILYGGLTQISSLGSGHYHR
jgi:hypothetical protein